LSTKLKFVQNQDYEGIKITYEKADGTPLDVSSLTESVIKVFKRDYSATVFTGTYGTGEIDFLTDGTDGILVFTPDSTDMATDGLYRGEWETTLSSKKLKKQEFLVEIKREAP
jgi:hypothetical protein